MNLAPTSAAPAGGKMSQLDHTEVKKRKIWEVATSPRKQMMMMVFMMWMAGNELSIFPIMITGQALYSPISSIMGSAKVFEKVVDGIDGSRELQDEIGRARLAFIAHQIVFLVLGLVKCYYLGLVPTNSLDWIDHNPYRPSEVAFGAFSS